MKSKFQSFVLGLSSGFLPIESVRSGDFKFLHEAVGIDRERCPQSQPDKEPTPEQVARQLNHWRHSK